MAIVILQVEGGFAPVVVCDHCGEQIKEARDGNVEWDSVEAEPGTQLAPFFLHKRCSVPFEKSRNGFHSHSEMTATLYRLIHNTQLDLEDAAEVVSDLERLPGGNQNSQQ